MADWVDVPAAPKPAASGWVDVPAAPKPAASGWEDVPKVAAAGWVDIKPEGEEKPNLAVRSGAATPDSPVGQASGVGDYFAKIPARVGAWWKEGREQQDAAVEQIAGEKGKLPAKVDVDSPLTRQIVNNAMGFAGGGIPAKGAMPLTNLPVGRAPGIMTPVSTGAASQVAKQIGKTVAKPVADTLEKVFSPTTVSPIARGAEGLIREKVGQRAQATEQARAQMDEFQQLVNSKTPQEQNAFVAHVEDTKGTPLADPTLQPVADSLKKIYDERMTALQAMPSTAKAAFIEDYYPHMWKGKGPTNAPGSDIGTGQGSGRSLKERSIPTLQDGLARGLEPVHQNPLEATLAYVTNMDRFIAHNQILDTAKASGTVKSFPAGRQPDGWVPLKGRLAESGTGGLGRNYAPEDFARVYNNFISRGFHDFPTGGKIYDALQKASNALTMSELSFSGFHAATMVQEGMVSELSNALGKGLRGEIVPGIRKAKDALTPFDLEQGRLAGVGAKKLASGDIKGGAASLGKAAIPAGARKLIDKGLDFEQQYLNKANFGPEMAKAVELGAKANMRAVASRAQEYKGSAQGSFWDSWKAGKLGGELKTSAGKLAQGNVMEGARLVGRTMDTVAQPLFDKMIPRMKNGAFYSEITDWLAAHPGATDSEQAAAARQIWDSIDNRFGELQLDNVFWNKMLKQSMQLMLRAVGWDLGTVREVAGGGIDIGRGTKSGWQGVKDLSPRAKYAVALPVVAALLAQVWSYLKTGQPSPDPFTYPTGGTLPDGQPEKAMVPGYMKDVVGYARDPVDTATGKLATAPRTVYELLRNRDYRDMPIAEMSSWAEAQGAPPPAIAYMMHVLKAGVPISAKMLDQKEGSNISPIERLFGMSPASRAMSEPDEMQRIMNRAAMRKDKAKEKSDRRLESQYGR